MRLSKIALPVLTFPHVIHAYKGMTGATAELLSILTADSNGVVEMIGDLQTGPSTTTGNEIRDCLIGDGDCQSTVSRAYSYTAPGELGSPECTADKCCAFGHLGKELRKLFVDKDGFCTQAARASIRLGFHDAAGWSKKSDYGGADGSILLNDEEITGDHNGGLEDIRGTALGLLERYKHYGVSAADLVQFMATNGVVSCPLGPRIKTYVGRIDNPKAPPHGLIPDHTANASTLIKLFAEKTFSVTDLAALLGAHTTANQFQVAPETSGQSLDSTPGVWDTRFYSETLANTKINGVSRIPSDLLLAKDNRTATAFRVFSVAQGPWQVVFSQAFVRATILGVKNVTELTDCTKVLPAQSLTVPARKTAAKASPTPSRSPRMWKWRA